MLDLIASVKMRLPPHAQAEPDSNTWLALTHIEIESQDRKSDLEERLPAYLVYLRSQHQLPVLPIVIYLSMSLDGIGIESVHWRIADFNYLTVNYCYVALKGLDAETYIRGENLLGVGLASLMKMPQDRTAELGFQALKKLDNAELPDQKRYLLSECFEAYLSISEQELNEIRDRIPLDPERRMTMPLHRNKTSFDLGLEAGQEKGRQEGQRVAFIEMLEAQLETRFGPLKPESLTKLRAMTVEELRALGLAWLKANSLGELGL